MAMLHIDRGFRGAGLTAAQRAYNRTVSKVRVCVEWQFRKVTSFYPFIDHKTNLKFLLQPIDKYYTIAALLSNARTCLYGSITGKYFNVNPPSLEDYFDYVVTSGAERI